jgi:hypothetical protein
MPAEGTVIRGPAPDKGQEAADPAGCGLGALELDDWPTKKVQRQLGLDFQ